MSAGPAPDQEVRQEPVLDMLQKREENIEGGSRDA